MHPRWGFTAGQVFLVCSVFFLLLVSDADAQDNDISPFSRFGIGDPQPRTLVSGFSMGGLEQVHAEADQLNIGNPATFAAIRKPAFEVGGSYTGLRQYGRSDTSDFHLNGLRHMGLALPIAERWGVAFGLAPYSTVGYDISFLEETSDVGTVETQRSGEGGLKRFFLGTGFQPLRHTDTTVLAFGVNASFLFGRLEYNSETRFIDEPRLFDIRKKVVTRVKDLILEAGMHFEKRVGKELSNRVIGGATVELPKDLSGERELLAESFVRGPDGGVGLIMDTAQWERSNGHFRMPLRVSGGVGLELNERWLFAAEFKYRDWSDFSSSFDGSRDEGANLSTSWRLGGGIEYTPAPELEPTASLFSIFDYRIGGSFERTHLTFKGAPVDRIGTSFGVGIPIGDRNEQGGPPSTLNVGVELGKRGDLWEHTLEERFIKAYVGFSFSPSGRNQWFYDKKYK